MRLANLKNVVKNLVENTKYVIGNFLIAKRERIIKDIHMWQVQDMRTFLVDIRTVQVCHVEFHMLRVLLEERM